MLELIITVFFIWLLIKSIGLTFKVAWGITKIIACILFVIAVPLLVLCLLFVGGLFLLVPLALIAIAFGLLKRI